MTELLDRPPSDPEVAAARAQVLADPRVEALCNSLPDWETEATASGHNSPSYAPNLLQLLADMGVQGGDHSRVESLLDSMLQHQDADGRFQLFGRSGSRPDRAEPGPRWGALSCDIHSITEVLLRFGRLEDKRTQAGLQRMAADLSETAQGPGWLCLPDTASGFRGPGRQTDFCPQVTLEALRAFARLPVEQRPLGVLAAARTCLRAWHVRSDEQPYIFGHARRLKTFKWPAIWYDVHWVLDTVSRYPALWRGTDARSEDRRAISELAACLVTYNFGADGKVTPQSCYRGFGRFSFGNKKAPSPFATARLCAIVRRLDCLTDDIRSVDVLELGSSKGGSGRALPPRS